MDIGSCRCKASERGDLTWNPICPIHTRPFAEETENVSRITETDKQILLGALDTLGTALASHNHTWSTGERTIYEEATKIVAAEPNDNNVEQP